MICLPVLCSASRLSVIPDAGHHYSVAGTPVFAGAELVQQYPNDHHYARCGYDEATRHDNFSTPVRKESRHTLSSAFCLGRVSDLRHPFID